MSKDNQDVGRNVRGIGQQGECLPSMQLGLAPLSVLSPPEVSPELQKFTRPQPHMPTVLVPVLPRAFVLPGVLTPPPGPHSTHTDLCVWSKHAFLTPHHSCSLPPSGWPTVPMYLIFSFSVTTLLSREL